MKVLFRADASIDIGTGHIMRCLTLATALKKNGAICSFICRVFEGDLIRFIESLGFQVYVVGGGQAYQSDNEFDSAGCVLFHQQWLGVTQAQDFNESLPALQDFDADWLVVDHYAIDVNWESKARRYVKKLMVIDDLADREHECDLLLDQTIGREPCDYENLLPDAAVKLCGCEFALLRPEFRSEREASLKRRSSGELNHIIVSLGGVDKNNVTGLILQAINDSSLPDDIRITVVIGSTSPWRRSLELMAQEIKRPIEVLVGVSNMAKVMSASDLAIGAAGATSWERCCLGIPTVMVVLAENQKLISQNLVTAGAAVGVDVEQIKSGGLSVELDRFQNNRCLSKHSIAASGCVDGLGVNRVISFFGELA